ncbi:hypothetical protein [Nitrosopumilus sp.]|uniref:hypothetical protein n=1 Tax=Nitrosopumilus sp. TaxID=2024843 RepID=UPI0029313CA2|nr:hypothetical protein [Nitrosopumilus sp.]
MVCKGICHRYRAKKPRMNSRYETGQKRCSQCEIFINWEGKYCPCCGSPLRTRPKGTNTRNRLTMLQQVKRI